MVKRNKLISALIVGCLCTLGVQAQTFELRDGWECQSSAIVGTDGASLSTGGHSSAPWYSTQVPTTVMGMLVSNGEYPKLLERDNYKKYEGEANSRFLVPLVLQEEFPVRWPERPRAREAALRRPEL